MMPRIKELEVENARLNNMFIEEKPKAEILNEVIPKKVVRPSRSREMA